MIKNALRMKKINWIYPEKLEKIELLSCRTVQATNINKEY